MPVERLEALGLRDDNINKKVLHCNICILCGGCTVSSENMFLGEFDFFIVLQAEGLSKLYLIGCSSLI
jgi:hypothetical protein